MALTEQHQHFCNRVARLEQAHGVNARRGARQAGVRAAVYHVGLDETMNAEQVDRALGRFRGKAGKMRRGKGPLGLLVGLPLSFLMGVLGVALAWWGIFAYTHGDTALALTGDATMAMALVAVAAMGAVLLLRVFTASDLTAHTVTQVLGVVAGVALLHNAVHLYPDHWAMLFSDAWVAQVRGVTQAHSLMLPGMSIPLPAVL